MVRTRSIRNVEPGSSPGSAPSGSSGSFCSRGGKRRSVTMLAVDADAANQFSHAVRQEELGKKCKRGLTSVRRDISDDLPSPSANEDNASELVHVAPMEHSGNEGHIDGLLVATRESGVQTTSLDPSSSTACHFPEDLRLTLECPVCNRIALPPIRQCRNGHVTCNTCRAKVQTCPVCREMDVDIRNLIAEKAIAYMKVPCEHAYFGCKAEVQYREKENHEKVCKFRPYICPYIECDHKLSSDVVVEHVSTAHGEECRRSDGPEITASMILMGQNFGGDGAWSPRLITCFGKTFFDVALTRDRWLHHWVWLLGEENEAQQYLYEITAFKGNVKYVYGGEVASLRTSDDEIVSDGQCLSISDAIGRRLKDGDKIRYKLKLIKKGDGKRQN